MFFVLFLLDDRRIRIRSLTNGSGSGRHKKIPCGARSATLLQRLLLYLQKNGAEWGKGCDGLARRGIHVGRNGWAPAAGRRVSRHSCPARGVTSRSAVLSPATWSEQSSARAAPPSATSHRSPGLASTFIGKENMYCSAATSSQVLDPEFLFWSRQACLVHILSTLESSVPVPDP